VADAKEELKPFKRFKLSFRNYHRAKAAVLMKYQLALELVRIAD
jgi:hypothetical protein